MLPKGDKYKRSVRRNVENNGTNVLRGSKKNTKQSPFWAPTNVCHKHIKYKKNRGHSDGGMGRRITTSRPCSTRRLAFSRTISATWTKIQRALSALRRRLQLLFGGFEVARVSFFGRSLEIQWAIDGLSGLGITSGSMVSSLFCQKS